MEKPVGSPAAGSMSNIAPVEPQTGQTTEGHIEQKAQSALSTSSDELARRLPGINKNHHFSILSGLADKVKEAKGTFYSAAKAIANLYNKIFGAKESSTESTSVQDASKMPEPIAKPEEKKKESKEEKAVAETPHAASPAVASQPGEVAENPTPPPAAKKEGHEGVRQTMEEMDQEYNSMLKEIDEFKKAHPDSNYVSKKELELRNAHSRAVLHGNTGNRTGNETSQSFVNNFKDKMNDMRVALGKQTTASESSEDRIAVTGKELHEAKKNLAEYRGISSTAIDETRKLFAKYQAKIGESDDKKLSKLVYDLTVLQNDLDNLAEWGSTEKGKNMKGKAAELMNQIDAKAAELRKFTAEVEKKAKQA